MVRYKTAAENAEKVEDELKAEKRKLQREVSVSFFFQWKISNSIVIELWMCAIFKGSLRLLLFQSNINTLSIGFLQL